MQQATALAFGERGHRHTRGHGDDVGDLTHIDGERAGVELGGPGGLGLGELNLGGLLLLSDLGSLVHVVALGGLLCGGLELLYAMLGIAHRLGSAIRGDASAGTGLVNEVDGLIGQKAILDIAVGQVRGGLDSTLRIAHMVVLFVARLERGQDLDRILDARLLDIDGLEATLEGRVLGEVLAEFLGRGGADNLESTAREHGLEHRARIDGALGRTGTDDGMHLVNKQDNVVGFGRLLDHVLESLLKLTAILGARNKTRQVERPDILVHKVLGHIASSNLLRQALDDSRLAHAGIAQDKRIVLGAARKDLHHALDFLFATNHGIELAVARLLRKVGGELLECVGATPLLLRGIRAAKERQARTGTTSTGAGERTLLILVLGSELFDGLFNGSRRHAQAHEDVHGHAVAIFDDADQQVLGRNVGLVVLACHAEGALHHADDERRKGELGSLGLLAGLGNRGLDLFEGIHDVIVGDIERAQCLGGNTLVLLSERKQQVLGAHLI